MTMRIESLASPDCADASRRAFALALAGCSGQAPENAAKTMRTTATRAELFTIPADQMAHVQVLTVAADHV